MYPFLGISCKPCIDWRCPTLERILLLFSHERPCWDEETLALAGEDPHALRELEDSGWVEHNGSVLLTTAPVRRLYEEVARW